MGRKGHVHVRDIRDLLNLSAYIEKFIFPSLLCIVTYSQMAKIGRTENMKYIIFKFITNHTGIGPRAIALT
jgi:hypothetical protein